MATSLSFGLIFATALVLVLAPVFYLILARATESFMSYIASNDRSADALEPQSKETSLSVESP